jgi:signal transduction histidine kinase
LHKLLSYQMRCAARQDGVADNDALLASVARSYEEFDRERRRNDRLAKLLEEDLKEANEKIKRLGEQRLSETLECMPSAIALLTEGFALQSFNTALKELCAARARRPKKGDGFADLLEALSPETPMPEGLQRLIRDGQIEVKIAGQWFLAAAHRFSDAGYAVAFSDISALKEREAMLAIARDAAESANRLKSHFLATMSHELRTPLNAILGFSEVIRSCALGHGETAWKRYLEYANSINDSGQHLLNLISNVLDLSKIESGSYQLEFEPCDLAAAYCEAQRLVHMQAEMNKVGLLPLQANGDLTLFADRRALGQILSNLLSNAVKFTPEGGEVDVTAQGDAESISLCVRDTGIGISPEQMEHVFEPFHQGDAHIARRFTGSGLGLSVTRGLVALHGGTLALESEPNVGTRATVTLPRRVGAEAHKAA